MENLRWRFEPASTDDLGRRIGSITRLSGKLYTVPGNSFISLLGTKESKMVAAAPRMFSLLKEARDLLEAQNGYPPLPLTDEMGEVIRELEE